MPRLFLLQRWLLRLFGVWPKKMVHRHRRLIAARLSHDPRRNPGDSFAGRHRLQHDRARSDPTAMADGDVAQHLCACADQHAVANFGVPIFFFLAGADESAKVDLFALVPLFSSFLSVIKFIFSISSCERYWVFSKLINFSTEESFDGLYVEISPKKFFELSIGKQSLSQSSFGNVSLLKYFAPFGLSIFTK